MPLALPKQPVPTPDSPQETLGATWSQAEIQSHLGWGSCAQGLSVCISGGEGQLP